MAGSWVTPTFQCVLILVSMSTVYPDEFLPKRLLSHPKDALPSQSDTNLPTQDKTDISHIQPCGIQCFLKPPLYEMVACDNLMSHSVYGAKKLITCNQNLERGEIVLGQKESVRGILPGAIESLVKSTGENLLRTGQMSIHINLNMVNLDKNVFQGLGTVISELRILNIVYIHPDSLIELQHLSLFEVETGRPPLTLLTNTTKNAKEVTGYFRTHPVDLSAPITFNMETKCYRCSMDSKPVFVIAFKEHRRQVTTQLSHKSGLNFLFPYSCPNKPNANGCMGNSSAIDDIPLSGGSGADPSVNASAAEDRTPSVLILLSIWCTVLTIAVITVVCILYLCSRYLKQVRIPNHRQKQQWLSNLCPYSPSSTDEVSSDSTNSAFIPKHTLSSYVLHAAEHQPNGTDLSTSPSTVAIRSKSTYSLRDKARVSTHTSTDQFAPNGQYASTRRSIGSQTDFTIIDPELDIFSSMRRSQLNASQRSSFIFTREPLSRTVSHHTLSRSRNGFQKNDYSTCGSKRQSTNFNAIIMQLGQDPDVEFLMTGSLPKPPVVQAVMKSSKLPPIYPNYRRELSSSPVPWSKGQHYTSIMDA